VGDVTGLMGTQGSERQTWTQSQVFWKHGRCQALHGVHWTLCNDKLTVGHFVTKVTA
jgi:hypothetical protein